MRHRFHHIGSRDEHVAGIFHHEDEIGQRRAVHRPARAGSHDHADLWDDAACQRVAQEDVGIAAQTDHTLLNPRAAAVVQADHWSASFHRHFHHFDDLLGVDFAQTATHDREILREHVHQPPVDRPPACHHTIAENFLPIQPEIARAVCDKRIKFAEAARIEQNVQPFTGGVASGVVLALDTFLATAHAALIAQRA